MGNTREYNKWYYEHNKTAMSNYRKTHRQQFSRYYANKYRNDPEHRERVKKTMCKVYHKYRQRKIDYMIKRYRDNPEPQKLYGKFYRLQKKIFNYIKKYNISGMIIYSIKRDGRGRPLSKKLIRQKV